MAIKIFNWMQWKMKPNTSVYSRVPHKHPPDVFVDGKEMESNDQEALLLHNVLLDGILTIGTLGQLQDMHHHHHSPLVKHQQEFDINDKLEDEKNVEQEVVEMIKVGMQVPASLSVSKSLRSSFREKENENEKVVVKVVKDQQQDQQQHCDHKELNMDEPLLKEDKERSEKGRTTLADLFAASDASPKKVKTSTTSLLIKEKITTKEDEKKKMMNKNKENSLLTEGKTKTTIKATKKMQRLITRMMKKKKVHPEMAVNGMAETHVSLMSKEMEKISLINQDIEEHPWRDEAVHQIG